MMASRMSVASAGRPGGYSSQQGREREHFCFWAQAPERGVEVEPGPRPPLGPSCPQGRLWNERCTGPVRGSGAKPQGPGKQACSPLPSPGSTGPLGVPQAHPMGTGGCRRSSARGLREGPDSGWSDGDQLLSEGVT